MNSFDDFSESTTADKSSAGFDYQYYYFLWKVLSLKHGQSVGLECKDDVHIDLDNDIQVLYQLKHTVKTSNVTNKPANLTDLDSDLWKTLSNWVDIIKYAKAGRTLPSVQLKFLKITNFVLASNKSNSGNNRFINLVEKARNGELSLSEVAIQVKNITSKSKSDDIKNYTDNIISLDSSVLLEFLKKIEFELEENDIIRRCHEAILSCMIDERHVENVFKLVDSSIREDNFINIKKGVKCVVSFDDFYRKYRKHFQNHQNEGLVLYDFNEIIPDRIEEFTFIKQLIDIGDISESDTDEIVEFATYMISAKKNLNSWLENGELTNMQLNNEKSQSILEWKNKWRKTYRGELNEEEHSKLAIKLVDTLRDSPLNFNSLPKDLTFSNGFLYYLSDLPEIGWRKDWSKYKNE
ncbi:hypothetical protein MW343_001443 [Vibrio parahaemolyticus]|uniref:hypothetical protein n=1 Tax=Vibrio TaxID=662 RepID=UPI001A290FA1|nr:hypothetical protein [Vibrio vulnificus]EJB8532284.1 hypothetical protein [Vibrio parahaemolyticus]EJC6747887.1 hypothetical protein [Vibrio parahaemolyticus]EJE8517198.1 hypothetical protein [Vibrio parahaemolyticus]ELH3488733.1 hypothetical protein [Vibrio vulnificus]